MNDELDEFSRGAVTLGELVSRIRGLYSAAEISDPDVRTAFETAWIKLDYENELRTEPWAPVGSATEEGLENALLGMSDWIFETASVGHQ